MFENTLAVSTVTVKSANVEHFPRMSSANFSFDSGILYPSFSS